MLLRIVSADGVNEFGSTVSVNDSVIVLSLRLMSNPVKAGAVSSTV